MTVRHVRGIRAFTCLLSAAVLVVSLLSADGALAQRANQQPPQNPGQGQGGGQAGNPPAQKPPANHEKIKTQEEKRKEFCSKDENKAHQMCQQS